MKIEYLHDISGIGVFFKDYIFYFDGRISLFSLKDENNTYYLCLKDADSKNHTDFIVETTFKDLLKMVENEKRVKDIFLGNKDVLVGHKSIMGNKLKYKWEDTLKFSGLDYFKNEYHWNFTNQDAEEFKNAHLKEWFKSQH